MKLLTYSTESRKSEYSVCQNLYVYANQVYPYHIYKKNSSTSEDNHSSQLRKMVHHLIYTSLQYTFLNKAFIVHPYKQKRCWM